MGLNLKLMAFKKKRVGNWWHGDSYYIMLAREDVLTWHDSSIENLLEVSKFRSEW